MADILILKNIKYEETLKVCNSETRRDPPTQFGVLLDDCIRRVSLVSHKSSHNYPSALLPPSPSLSVFLSSHINTIASVQTETHSDTSCLLNMISVERRWEVE